ncbi:PAS domain-containing protein [Massilia sp. IC2-477]|uniref:response regulator n=1 Tax=unclassified Massilia TaxID=2609279 RepID=UPI001D112E39|nr:MULTISPECIES: response regulator [unclassified Massilia]MCC2958647.1 PAS domain-containing protein [Massilia sp. IC2-477]MCC2971154.1 PAS domain-containing protein [Massilia sp. IC2-476]
MATGSEKDEHLDKPLDVQGGGQSMGVQAVGEVDGNTVSPTGGPGVNHWQAGYIGQRGLDDRANVFFAAVEMTRMPMLVTDPNQEDDPIVFVNGAFLDLTGYEEKDVLGRNCRFLQGPDTDRATVDEVRKALREHRAVSVDLLNYKANGEPFWNALFIGPIFDQDGKLLYFFASQMDITERRSMLESNLQAQKMEAIGQLSAGMAHDFNNLLQVINGNLELALLTAGKLPAAADPIRRAQRATMQAGKLTQQLLSFARKQRLEQKRVSLNSLVVDFSDMLVRTLGDKLELRLDLRPGLPPCSLDPTYLEMALLNVVINARDAMPNGGTVTVGTAVVSEERRLANRLAPGEYVAICVNDEGEGMPPDVLKRATEPFFTTKGLGTGLGLAMVHGFVQQSHGRLDIESEAGRGTRVRMIFPVAQQLRDEAGGADGIAAEAEEAGRKCRILVVEDNEDVRELAEAMLAAADYEVVSAPSGERALELLESEKVDLLFTDVIMPGGMNGLQLIEQVHARRPGMPVLVTTGYMDELPARGARDKSLDVLAKPYQHQDLLDRVHAALHARRAA